MTRARRTFPFCAGGVPGVLALALSLALSSVACKKTALYTYVSVHVVIDASTVSNDQLSQVSNCLFRVTGAEMSQARNIRCPPPDAYDVGTFEWETQVPQGALAFVVQILDLNQGVIGQGTSESVSILPGKHLTASVLVRGIQPADPDGGTMMDAATGDSADASTTNDGGVDGGDGSIVDRASDGSISADAGTGDEAMTDLAIDAGMADGAVTDLLTGDVANDAGTPSDARTEVPPASEAGTDGQSGDGASDATTDNRGDGPEAG